MSSDQEQAQARADRIRAFREELAALEREGVVALDEGQRAAVDAHQTGLLAALTSAHDVDVSGAQKRLSWGVRIVAFLGAAALSAAVYFLFQRVWGQLPLPAQVTLLVAAPLAVLAVLPLAARRDRSGAFATIVALVAFACFVLDLTLLGRIFAITPTQHALLVWAAFAFLLAYGFALRLLLIAGILTLLAWLSATVGVWGGLYWLQVGERPEHFILAGALVFGLGLLPHRVHPGFPGAYRVFGALAALVAVLILGHWGAGSLLPLPYRSIEHLYQVAGFALSGGAIWSGLRYGWPGLVTLGSTSFTVFLYTRFFAWWWDWMPRALFFLLVGLVAILSLLILKRLRAAGQEVRP